MFDPIKHKYEIYKFSSDYEIIKYKDLNNETKKNLYNFYSLHRDNICCDLETAKKKYTVSFNSIKFIKNKADQIGAKLFLSTYPYAWYIDPDQSLEWQLKLYKGNYILDFRGNDVYPNLVNFYADQLKIKNFNFYNYVKNNPKYWGKYDPHFNKLGYRKYSEFLSDKIVGEIINNN